MSTTETAPVQTTTYAERRARRDAKYKAVRAAQSAKFSAGAAQIRQNLGSVDDAHRSPLPQSVGAYGLPDTTYIKL